MVVDTSRLPLLVSKSAYSSTCRAFDPRLSVMRVGT